MKIAFVYIGKTQKKFIQQGIDEYSNRIKHYVPFEIIMVNPPKKMQKSSSKEEVIKQEEANLLKVLKDDDFIILLDEKGKSYRSVEFAEYLQKLFLIGNKRMVFVIGGAWGFSSHFKKRAHGILSLSKMTFSHQIIRIIFLEQLYRAFTIIKNEPYHNE